MFSAFIIQLLPEEVNNHRRRPAAYKNLLLAESGHLICGSLQFRDGDIYLTNGGDALAYADILSPEGLIVTITGGLM